MALHHSIVFFLLLPPFLKFDSGNIPQVIFPVQLRWSQLRVIHEKFFFFLFFLLFLRTDLGDCVISLKLRSPPVAGERHNPD